MCAVPQATKCNDCYACDGYIMTVCVYTAASLELSAKEETVVLALLTMAIASLSVARTIYRCRSRIGASLLHD